jgi:drug/metabolite transporter (DMT)-like permease
MSVAGLAVGYAFSTLDVSRRGVVLALLSGAIASGLGYSLWYLALPGLGATRAAVVQLVVPVLAAVLGVVLLGERATPRLLVSGAAILGGVGIAVWFRGARSGGAPAGTSRTGSDVPARRP